MVNMYSEAMKKRWANPEQREKFIKSRIGNKNRLGKETQQTAKIKISEKLKKVWASKKKRHQQSEKLKKYYQKNSNPKPNVTILDFRKFWSEERREAKRQQTKELWKNPEFIKKVVGRKRSENSKARMSLSQIKLNLERGSKGHPLYKNGKNARKYGIGYSLRIRKKVLERDGFKCVVCSATKRLQVHHVDFSRDNNILENLKTYCLSCHRKIHRGEKIC